MNRTRTALITFGMCMGAVVFAQPPEPTRVIEQVTGDLYFAKNNNHNSVFLVTPEGIILGDPINAGFTTWLKEELATRFPDRPVRYVLHSHHHFDHSSGAAVLSDTAESIGHENFNTELAKSSTTLPGILRRFDSNNNNQVERAELEGGPLAAFFAFADLDRNDVVTPEEMYTDVREPDSLFSDRRSVTLGGKTVEMLAPGPNHSLDAAVLYFPDERAVFAVDYITVRNRFPGGFDDGAPLEDWISAIRAVEALDFDIIIPGHGDVARKADLTAYREYFETLVATVREGISAGRTVEELQRDSIFERYSDWVNFPQAKNQNVAAAHAVMSAAR